VPPSWDIDRDCPFRSPDPVSWLFELLIFFDPPAAEPPVARDESLEPSVAVDVPPVPSVLEAVPPAAAEPPVPPVALVCAKAGPAATKAARAPTLRPRRNTEAVFRK
jgi:hypothetical protein